ncbi:MAG: tetratricopeptide repeat protein [Bacteroidota bacterium]
MKNTLAYITAFLLFAAVIPGCAVYDPFAEYTKQRYTNVVSYFNTFYNAQRLFSDAEDEVLKARRDYYERNSTGKPLAIPSSARQKFQTSIEKNSKVLSFYPNSKWVDDALLMIGKAYYYMEDDVRAERKFQELAVQFPQSDVVPESQLWLGKSLMRQKKYESGIKELNNVFTKTLGTDEEIAGQAAFELGQYYFELNDFLQAEKQYSSAADLINDNELRTRIYFQIGKCFTELDSIENAQQAYSKAMDISPIYSFKFQAQLQTQKLFASQKQYQQAINGLSEMLNDTKNSEYFGTIHYELANVLMMNGQTEEAVLKYRYIDTAFARTDEAVRSYYTLAQYYQEKELNYDSARVLYGKARVEFAASEITKIAGERADIFNKYDQLRKDLTRYDSLLTGIIEAKLRNDSLALSPSADSVKVRDSVIVKEEVKIKKMTKAGKVSKDTAAAFVALDSLKIKEKLNREESHLKMVDSLQRSIIRTKFELGGIFFLEIQQPDSAQRWFNEVIASAPASEYAPRSIYTIAEIYRGMLKRPSAELEPYYKRIITEYPGSPYANEARKNLALPVIIAEKDSALIAFENAEGTNEKGKYEQAIGEFKRIHEKYPTSPFASKSLYTAAWIYENSLLKTDSAVAVYRRVVAKYPLSQYSSMARPKIQEYENELQRIEEEKQKAIEEKKLKEQQEKEAKLQKEKKPEPAVSDSLSTTPKKL